MSHKRVASATHLTILDSCWLTLFVNFESVIDSEVAATYTAANVYVFPFLLVIDSVYSEGERRVLEETLVELLANLLQTSQSVVFYQFNWSQVYECLGCSKRLVVNHFVPVAGIELPVLLLGQLKSFFFADCIYFSISGGFVIWACLGRALTFRRNRKKFFGPNCDELLRLLSFTRLENLFTLEVVLGRAKRYRRLALACLHLLQ